MDMNAAYRGGRPHVAGRSTAVADGATRSPRPSSRTADELRRFLDFVATSRYVVAWVFLATTGCRRGECLGVAGKTPTSTVPLP